ncbi:GIY-YIG nuclease family protein [Pseudochryseolinea flava]|uniref:GIY-YIG nuclease family protein n=1 Tax=Pseudochryseolinea flava TaxID=2059302 RepID=UPI0014027E26|nr:GIY-YIG nuclease family protein [Pseudochryseolinea flava]
MRYYTYIIFSETTNRYYIGHTENLDNRLHEHNTGETSRSGMAFLGYCYGRWSVIHELMQ